MTTGISLVRENAASIQPPRSLWVTFPLGRPLGVPGDPAFQHGVIRAALALLETRSGPILADYPLDEAGTTYRSMVLQKYPGLDITHMHHAGNSSGVVDGAVERDA